MITTADAREWLGLGSDQDLRLAAMITEATATLGRELGRYLGPPITKVELKCGGAMGTTSVFCSDDPQVSESTPMIVATRFSPFEAFATLAVEDWALVGQEVIAKGAFPPGRGSVRLSYFVGFAPGTGPAELRDLVRQLVALRYASRPDAESGAPFASETIGDYSYTRGDVEALAGWASVVSRWRRRLV